MLMFSVSVLPTFQGTSLWLLTVVVICLCGKLFQSLKELTILTLRCDPQPSATRRNTMYRSSAEND